LRKGTASAVPKRQPKKGGFSHWGTFFFSPMAMPRKSIPLRLKPIALRGIYGTAEAVPFPKSCGRRDIKNNNSTPAQPVSASGIPLTPTTNPAGHNHQSAIPTEAHPDFLPGCVN
jgi:hypothetical protein